MYLNIESWIYLTIINNLICIFKMQCYQNIWINFDLFLKNNNGNFATCFDQVYSWNLV